MASAQALLWWSSRDLEQLAAVFENPWTEWLRGWHGASTGASVRCLLAQDASHLRSWSPFAGAGPALAWWDDAEPGDPVNTALFGRECQVAATGVAGGLELTARLALRERLAHALGMPTSGGHDARLPLQCEPWSGSVIVQLASASLSTRLLLNGPCVGALIGSSVGQECRHTTGPVEDGVSAMTIRASIEVTGVEITLGSLQAIHCGDIVRLPHSLDEPLQVTVHAQRVCAAFLGVRDGQRAVELTPV